MIDNTNNPNDPFLTHEALDRTSLMADMLDNHLLLHPYVQRTPDVLALIEGACDKLHAAYQLIGERHL
jgi:hypothetical protein